MQITPSCSELFIRSYLPMQEMENSEYQLVKYSSNEY